MSTTINPRFKRYLMFGYSYYPKGGLNDAIFEFGTIEELKAKADDHPEHFLHDTLCILDLQERRLIWEGSRSLTKYDLERLERTVEKISVSTLTGYKRKPARVVDTRNNVTLFTGTEWECMEFALENYPREEFPHVLIGVNDEDEDNEGDYKTIQQI